MTQEEMKQKEMKQNIIDWATDVFVAVGLFARDIKFEMKKSTAGAILAGTAATLGVMAMTGNPDKNEVDQNAPVFENFYDEQYLGTAFVEFRDRNKRYVY